MLTAEQHNQSTSRSRSVEECLVVGKESVGKSQLISGITRTFAGQANFRGSTVQVERYRGLDRDYIDTPGIMRRSDTRTTALALESLRATDRILLVVQATSLDDDLREMLPLVVGKQGTVVVTFWDKVTQGEAAQRAILQLSEDAGVPFVTVDARKLTDDCRANIESGLQLAKKFTKGSLARFAGWRIEPKAGLLEHRLLGPVLAILLLLLPALSTIYGANRIADFLNPIVSSYVDVAIAYVNTHGHPWLQFLLTAKQGDFGYGLLNMGPFLFVWALPTVLLFSVILAVYKATGLVDRMNWALHPLMRPLGLSGREAVRVMMGFGCNVPAVISTRACSGCSRGQAMSAIAFGAACSYQLPATLAVLAAAANATNTSAAWLTFVFLTYLFGTTVLYLRLTASRESRNSLNVLMTPSRTFMQWPSLSALWREMSSTIKQFFWQAMPIFVLICVAASLLAKFGVLDAISRILGPVMGLFNLPSESALAVVLASIRKDGIFLFAAEDGLSFPMTAAQSLTAVYLAGVLLPCLVTALTIAKESSWKQAGLLLAQQAAFAILFSLALAWGGRYFFSFSY
jgi:Fe2+ transport system protein B